MNSSVVRQQLGSRLRWQREQAGLTIRSVQNANIFSESKVARIEAGKVPVRIADVWVLCHLYGTDRATTDALAALAEKTTGASWWAEYADLVPEWFSLYVGLEEVCGGISIYHPAVVPDLFRTDGYARALRQSHGAFEEDVIAAQLKFQRERQRLVCERSNRVLRVVLDATVLTRGIGSFEVMNEQVVHLKRFGGMDGIDIRVLPWRVCPHPGLTQPFTVFDFGDNDDPPVVYLDSLLGGRYLKHGHQVEVYQGVFDDLVKNSIPINEYHETGELSRMP